MVKIDAFIKCLDDLFTATAWQTETPKAYGPFHLIFTIVGFSLSIFLAYLFRNSNDKQNKTILLSAGIFLILTEIYKQLFYVFCINSDEYSWGIFPFHLCSVPMYLCIIVPFLKNKKMQNGIYSFMMIYNLLGGFMAFVEPSGILHSYVTLTLHASLWHMTLVFIGLYLIASNRGGRTIKDYWASTIIFLILCVIAFLINLIFWDVSNGDINMFFVGPRNSSLIVFKQISERFGWYVSTILYIPTVCFGAYLIFLFITKIVCRSRKNPI